MEKLDELIAEYSDLDDKIVDDVARGSKTMEDFEAGLNQERVRQRAAPVIAEVESRLEAKFEEMIEDYDLDKSPKDIGAEPVEKEPEFGHWKPFEGCPWTRIQDEYSSGNLDSRLYETLQKQHAEETGEDPMRA